MYQLKNTSSELSSKLSDESNKIINDKCKELIEFLDDSKNADAAEYESLAKSLHDTCSPIIQDTHNKSAEGVQETITNEPTIDEGG